MREVWAVDDGWIAILYDTEEEPLRLTAADVAVWRLETVEKEA